MENIIKKIINVALSLLLGIGIFAAFTVFLCPSLEDSLKVFSLCFIWSAPLVFLIRKIREGKLNKSGWIIAVIIFFIEFAIIIFLLSKGPNIVP